MADSIKFTARLCAALFIFAVVLPLRLAAHPHNWITLKTEFFLDEQGQLTELHQYWAFDTYYSMITMADVMNNSEDQEKGLEQLAQEMVQNLNDHHYFSELKIDNHTIALATPNHYSLETVFQNSQQHLILHMRFQFTDPQQVAQKTLVWRVFDPTYYISMKHHDESQVIVHAPSKMECTTQIEQPKPSDDIIDYAASLDRTQKDTQGLGAKFAETVIAHCP